MEPASPEEAERLGEMSTEQLLPLVYDELRRLAAGRILQGAAGLTLQPTALVHEAWIRLGGKFDRSWESRDHFFNAAALAMRRILMDRARKKMTLKHGGEQARIELDPSLAAADNAGAGSGAGADERLILIDEALQRLEQESPEDARLISLKFFAGLTHPEIAETLGVNVRTVERKWAYAKVRLFQFVREIEGGAGPAA
jgi:RNA polymerase sigma factor (TIGR02999 family)